MLILKIKNLSKTIYVYNDKLKRRLKYFFFSKKKLLSNLKQHINKLFDALLYKIFVYIFYQILLKSLHVKLWNSCICKQCIGNVFVNSSWSDRVN